MFFIRQATTEDIPFIQQVANQIWPLAFKDILTLEQILYMMEMMYSDESLQKQMMDNNHVFHLAFIGHEPVGYVSHELNYNNSGIAKIHKLYVLSELHGSGLGKNLIEKVGQFASQAQQKGVTLNVNRNNQAVGFYEYLGFSITREENIDIGEGFLMEDYVMTYIFKS